MSDHPTRDAGPVLALAGVTRIFTRGAEAADRTGGVDGVVDVDLSVEAGRITALVGLNGAGKSTLLHLATGMLAPEAGTVTVFGEAIEELSPEGMRRVGALVDAPLAWPELTVAENLGAVDRLRSQTGTDRLRSSTPSPDRVAAALDDWDLTRLRSRRYAKLSLGNRQRVGLAAALMHDPDLVVLDEPGNALDPAAVILLREQLRARAASGAAVLVSSHHLDEVARIAETIHVMNGGRLIGTLPPHAPELERLFFETVRADDEARRTSGAVDGGAS